MKEELKRRIVEILEDKKQDMEGYSYFGSNFGVSEDDFDEIAEKIVEEVYKRKERE